MAVDDHGLETIRKAGEEIIPGDKSDYLIKVNDSINKAVLDAILVALGGSSSTTASISNETIASANTEQSFALPSSTKQFILRNRSSNDLRISYTSGGTTTSWVTLKQGAVFQDNNFYTSQSIFFQSPSAGDIIEIVTYV